MATLFVLCLLVLVVAASPGSAASSSWLRFLVPVGPVESPAVAGRGNCSAPGLDCSEHGDCASDRSHCRCDAGFTTFPPGAYPECGYEQKGKLTAFLLQFFLGWFFGAGMFYIAQIYIGLFQIAALWGGLAFVCCVSRCCTSEQKYPARKSVIAFLSVLVAGGTLLWNMSLWGLIISNKIADGNQAPLHRNM